MLHLSPLLPLSGRRSYRRLQRHGKYFTPHPSARPAYTAGHRFTRCRARPHVRDSIGRTEVFTITTLAKIKHPEPHNEEAKRAATRVFSS